MKVAVGGSRVVGGRSPSDWSPRSRASCTSPPLDEEGMVRTCYVYILRAPLRVEVSGVEEEFVVVKIGKAGSTSNVCTKDEPTNGFDRLNEFAFAWGYRQQGDAKLSLGCTSPTSTQLQDSVADIKFCAAIIIHRSKRGAAVSEHQKRMAAVRELAKTKNVHKGVLQNSFKVVTWGTVAAGYESMGTLSRG